MGQPYIGEIRMFGGNFAPAGWAFCNGQLMPISENDALFNLIGTTYGGDGQETFALPDLQGRLPIHMGQGRGTRPISSARRPASRRSRSPSSRSRSTPTRCWLGVDPGNADQPNPADNVVCAQPSHDAALHRRRAATSHMNARTHRAGRRQPAARQHAAVPVRQLHHLAVRHLPDARPRRSHMSDPFVAEIRMFACNFAPTGWAYCNGQLLPISQNTALFSLLGTYLRRRRQVDLRAAEPAGQCADAPGQGPGLSDHFLGEMGGTETVTLLESEMPVHTHMS